MVEFFGKEPASLTAGSGIEKRTFSQNRPQIFFPFLSVNEKTDFAEKRITGGIYGS